MALLFFVWLRVFTQRWSSWKHPDSCGKIKPGVIIEMEYLNTYHVWQEPSQLAM